MEEKIKLYIEKIPIYVSSRAVKVLILNELKRLEKVTGFSIKNIPVLFHHSNTFKNAGKSTVAFFQTVGSKPSCFCFFIDKFNNTSPNKIIDVCRHEFAHYITFMTHLGNQPLNPHGAEWKKVCAELGAKPSAVMDLSLTKHFESTK